MGANDLEIDLPVKKATLWWHRVVGAYSRNIVIIMPKPWNKTINIYGYILKEKEIVFQRLIEGIYSDIFCITEERFYRRKEFFVEQFNSEIVTVS